MVWLEVWFQHRAYIIYDYSEKMSSKRNNWIGRGIVPPICPFIRVVKLLKCLWILASFIIVYIVFMRYEELKARLNNCSTYIQNSFEPNSSKIATMYALWNAYTIPLYEILC